MPYDFLFPSSRNMLQENLKSTQNYIIFKQKVAYFCLTQLKTENNENFQLLYETVLFLS